MSSPVPNPISTAPTSIPREVSPVKDNTSNDGEIHSEGSRSDDTSSHASDSANKSSDDGAPPPLSLANVDLSSANNNEENPVSSETSDDDIGEFIAKVNDYATLLYNNAREGHDAKVRKYTRKLKRLARQFRKSDNMSQ